MKIEVHYGLFTNSRRKQWIVTIDDKPLTFEDGWGHSQIRLFKTETGARKTAAQLEVQQCQCSTN